MQRIIYLLISGLLFTTVCLAQFSATGGSNGVPYVYTPSVSTGLDKVFVFNGLTNSRLSYTAVNPSEWTWYRFEKDLLNPVLIPATDVLVTSTETVLMNVQAGFGYLVVSESGSRHSVFVVDYIPVNYSQIRFITDSDVCNTLLLSITADLQDLVYYTTNGLRKKLERTHTLSWNTLEWDLTNKSYVKKTVSSTSTNLTYDWSVIPPLTDTYFTVSGDQFANFFGSTNSYKSALYTAVAVKTNAQAEMKERNALNELDRISTSGDLSGSAPLDIQFYSRPSDAVLYNEWYIYDSPDALGSYKRYTDENLLHSFQESGTFLVKLYVSNGTCRDSASFNVTVSVSSLDCPNFFTPRSSPGENDEFRVAYKSIVSFKGTIVNRWGNVMFEWSDPAKGWNGTYKGKAVSPGVYFYLIQAKGSDGIVYKKKGDINLLE